MTTSETTDLATRLKRLGLYGLLANLKEIAHEPWVQTLLNYEEEERQRRSLERRLGNAKIGAFKPMADFDWAWPSKIDREAIEELLTLQILEDASNVVLVGPNGVGKSMVARNLAHQALLRGHTVRMTTASEMLNDLASQASATALNRRLRRYCTPQLLIVDEVGYLSYDNRYADLLFEVVTRRYGQRSMVVTTNKPFAQWNEVFPNAACVVTLVDRLVHRAEIITIEGESYRVKEAKERAATKARTRATRRHTPKS